MIEPEHPPMVEPERPPIVEPAPKSALPPLARRFRWSAIWSASGLVTSAVAYAVLGRCVAPSELGRAAVILSMWGLCSVAVDWCGSLLMRYGPLELRRRGSLGVTLSTRLVFAAPALAVLLPAAPAYFALVHGWPPWLLALTAAWLVASAALGVGQWCAVAAQRFGLLAVSDVLIRATPPLAIVALAAAGRPVRSAALVAATVGGTALGALLLLAKLRRLLGLERPDRSLLRAMWRYILPSLIAAPSAAAMSYVDPLVLARSASHAEVGRYQLAYVTVTVFGAVGASLNNVLAPELVGASAGGDARATVEYRQRHQPRLLVGLGLLPIAGACVAGPLLRLILPTSYAPAAEVAAILCVAGGLMLGVWTFLPLGTVTDSVWSMQLAQMASAATNVALDVVLAPRFGGVGVALANVAAWAVQLAAIGLLLRRRIGARGSVVAPLVAAAALVAALLFAGAPLALRAAVGAALLAVSVTVGWRAWRRQSRIVSPGGG